MKRKLLILFSLALAISMMAACRTQNDGGTVAQPEPATQAPAATQAEPATPATTPADTTADGPDPVEIRAAWWGDTVRHELYNSIIDLFEEEFPHITVIREPASFGDYWERFAVQVAGGNAPDFLSMHFAHVADFAPRGVMAPLQPFIDDDIVSFEGWSDFAYQSGYFDGVLYQMMMGFNVWGTFVNETAFEEIGVALPDFGWTWDEFRDKAVEVREALDARGERNRWLAGDSSGNFSAFRQGFLRPRGIDHYTPDGDFAGTVEDIIAWWTMWDEMRQLNLIPDPATGVEFEGVTLEDSMFARGRILAINYPPVNQISLFTNTFPDKRVGAVRNPTVPGAMAGEILQGASFAVSATATPERQLAAAKLMNFWLNDARAISLFMLDQGVIGNEALHPVIMENLNPAQQIQLDFVAYITALEQIPAIDVPPGAAEIESIFGLRAQEIAFGMRTIEDAAHDFLQEFAAIRERAER